MPHQKIIENQKSSSFTQLTTIFLKKLISYNKMEKNN